MYFSLILLATISQREPDTISTRRYIYQTLYLPYAISTIRYTYQTLYLPDAISTRRYIYKTLYLPDAISTRRYIYQTLYLPDAISTRRYIYQTLYLPDALSTRRYIYQTNFQQSVYLVSSISTLIFILLQKEHVFLLVPVPSNGLVSHNFVISYLNQSL